MTATDSYLKMTTAEYSGALYGALSKKQIASECRKHGWSGDDAREGKSNLADWLAAHAPTSLLVGLLSDTANSNATAQPEAPEQPTPEAVPVEVTALDRTAEITKLLTALLGVPTVAAIDEEKVVAIVDRRLQALQPAKIVLNGDAAPVKVDGLTHPLFEKTLRLARAGVNVLLVGPAGCGKSFLAQQVAEALGRDFGTLHCSAGVSESQVTGWLLPTGEGGAFQFVPSQFAKLYAQGNSLFLIDELDSADPNMLMVLNGALANGTLHIPQCAERPAWKRGENVALMAAANTYGTGADAQYVGRNQLDAATLDRFYLLCMEYDPVLEAQVMGAAGKPAAAWRAAADATPQELRELGEWCLALRGKVEKTKLRRIVSTRTIQKALAARCAGVPAVEVQRDVLAGWTRDELAKVEK